MLVSARDIAAVFGVGLEAVRREVARCGVQRRGRDGAASLYDWADVLAKTPKRWRDDVSGEINGLVTTHEVAERLGVEPDSFRQWAKHRGIRPKGNRARTQLWDWDEIDEHDPPEADGKVRYECRKCGRPRTGHFVPDACPSCVWRSLHQPTTEGEGFRQPAVYCTECGKPTKYGKPWCTDHVEQMPYVKWLLEQLAD